MISINSTANGVALEYNEASGWSVVVRDENLGLSLLNYRVLLSLLPFLEIAKEDILNEVNNSEALESFPEMILIEAGFINGSEHWVDCALDWVRGKSPEDISRFDLYLKSIFNDKKKYSQSIRHKAKALLKTAG